MLEDVLYLGSPLTRRRTLPEELADAIGTLEFWVMVTPSHSCTVLGDVSPIPNAALSAMATRRGGNRPR